MKRVLITGAAGGVGGMLLPGLTDRYHLVLTDRTESTDHELMAGDLTDQSFVRSLLSDVDAVVHLAANPDPGQPWERLRAPNADAVVNTLEAAASAGVRVVLASSAHVTGQYVARAVQPIDPELPPAPCCPYGAAKAFAEAYGRMVAYRYRTPVIALRLGATRPTPPASSALDSWIGPADLRQLVIRALDADLSGLPVPFTACHGISANTRSRWSSHNDIGYEPVLDAEAYADRVPVDHGWGPCRSDRPA